MVQAVASPHLVRGTHDLACERQAVLVMAGAVSLFPLRHIAVFPPGAQLCRVGSASAERVEIWMGRDRGGVLGFLVVAITLLAELLAQLALAGLASLDFVGVFDSFDQHG